MITYWSLEENSFAIQEYVQQRGELIANRFNVRAYEHLEAGTLLQGGAHIFAGSDQLSTAGQAVAAALYTTVKQTPGWRALNDPRRVLLRQPFLEAMAREGLNAFRVFPASVSDPTTRYPVFLRERNRHDGPLTGLLDSPGAVQRAVRSLRLRGYRLKELIQVEYVDTADAEGRYRKYSAYMIGDVLVRTHLMVSSHWSVKSDTNMTRMDIALEERDYLTGDLHEEWLRRVFALARIEYGRIDYGVASGIPQAWEINMAPTIGRRLGKPSRALEPDVQSVRDEGREHAHARLRDAFTALDRYTGDVHLVSCNLPPALLAAGHRERMSAARRERAVGMMRNAFHSHLLGRPVRALYRTIFKPG